MSADGTEQILNFTEDNSPLFSNSILDIAINHNTGEVFFVTDKGIISYKGTATMGDDYFSHVYTYPNPVPPRYTGYITIKGLAANVNVKITDISGNLVYETTSEGGQALWNGNTLSGKRVQTGVYLVFASSEDGIRTYVTKILFMN
jgi:flagellar hook assembly protein FlgD